MKYLLDTDTCILCLRHHPGLRARLEAVAPHDLAVSAMNEAELLYGARNSPDPVRNAERVAAFLGPLLVLPFDREAAREQARLRLALKAKPIGERDLVIASVAVANNLAVVTHNQREFGRIPGLRSLDWAAT